MKKGEKVDYAIIQNGEPVILIEAKSIQEPLDKHDSQLFRYFGTTKAKFAILTNGIQYKFYTDLEKQNMMDTIPFLELNLLDIRENQITQLYKFSKDNFDIENILTTASELKYTNEIINFLKVQWDNPSEDFITFILANVYTGKKTKQVIEKFSVLVKKSLNQFVNDMLNDKLQAAISNTNSEIEKEQEVASTKEQDTVEEAQVVTTEEEIEGYATVKIIVSDQVDPDRIFYRDNLSYCNVLLDDNIRKWICRLGFNGSNKYIQFNDEDKTNVYIENLSDILNHKERLKNVVKKFI
ncbi:type I restriction endonuclease [Chengkuizengella sp. SCS-71B]|uniref:type I restriction endonuclease n=1 Tax=Chengkuizengella sp. SCS-71B TaxID=3115290 RepID=UPI0039B73754